MDDCEGDVRRPPEPEWGESELEHRASGESPTGVGTTAEQGDTQERLEDDENREQSLEVREYDTDPERPIGVEQDELRYLTVDARCPNPEVDVGECAGDVGKTE